MKNEKKTMMVSILQKYGHWNISSSIDLLFLKSISAISINANPYIPSRFAEKKVFQFLFLFPTSCRKTRVLKSFKFFNNRSTLIYIYFHSWFTSEKISKFTFLIISMEKIVIWPLFFINVHMLLYFLRDLPTGLRVR